MQKNQTFKSKQSLQIKSSDLDLRAHYRKTLICLVSRPLPSTRPRALGKKLAHGMPGLYRVPAVGKAGHSAKCLLCRVLSQRHSTKPAHVPSTRARHAPPVRRADGVKSLSSATFWHSAKETCCRVTPAVTRQRRNFAECAGLALGKVSFSECWSLGTRQNWLKNFFLGLQIFFCLYLNLII